VERDVRFVEPEGGVRDVVDSAYRTTYVRYGQTYVVPMVSDDATAATFQLLPHAALVRAPRRR
jgi:hypothetical protein